MQELSMRNSVNSLQNRRAIFRVIFVLFCVYGSYSLAAAKLGSRSISKEVLEEQAVAVLISAAVGYSLKVRSDITYRNYTSGGSDSALARQYQADRNPRQAKLGYGLFRFDF